MQFSTKAGYGLRAMTNMAKCFPEQKTIKEIAKEENISQKYLERILGILNKNNLVTSHKGKSGGYVLAKNPKKINAGEIIETLEGTIAPMRCVGKFCSAKSKCPSSIVWNKLGIQIRKTLYNIKLRELIK
jgi:Rrf2 family transcriptional regulator, cysteine metabolism repressor